MTSKLTRERIELIANFHRAMTLPPSHDEIEELARMALAAMDSEPVAYRWNYGGTTIWRLLDTKPGPGSNPRCPRVIEPLYRHAQPAPELKPVGYIFVSGQGAIAYSPTDWGMPGFKLAGQIFGDIDVESQPAPVVPDAVDEGIDADDHPLLWSHNKGWNACRAAMLAAAPQEVKGEHRIRDEMDMGARITSHRFKV
ncbi:hypothetical protein [Raoultella terrigena]|uniref:hypothetical protein n=1 Tax=Raoultella terrigena TaxID=577 RepID=UPI00097760A6|nr:hypothetical protein [Raoultella terrigena]OMP92725.1 hypothetical protein BZP36_17715 [Raoultella terrigena]